MADNWNNHFYVGFEDMYAGLLPQNLYEPALVNNLDKRFADGGHSSTRVSDDDRPGVAAKRPKLSGDNDGGRKRGKTGRPSGAAATKPANNPDYQTTNILCFIQSSMMKSLWDCAAGKLLHNRIEDKGFHDAVSNPVYLGLIKCKLLMCQYNSSDEYLNDVRTMLDNILNYYQPGTALHIAAEKLDRLFKKKVKELPIEEERKQKPYWNPRHCRSMDLVHDPSMFDSIAATADTVDHNNGRREGWSCPDCTLLNTPEMTECECCGRKISIVEAAVFNPVKESVPEQSIEQEWSCLRCTMLNHPFLFCCECCGLERYSDVIAVAQDKPLWKSLPPSWSAPQPGVPCRKIYLSPTDPEYIEVAQNARRTAQNRIQEIVGIQRIENAKLYTLYNVSRTTMNDCNGRGSENENLLWHGTSPETVDIICNRGFNRSYCGKNATAFGKGVYFARDFIYSAHPSFSPPDRKNVRYIFQCRVLTGEYAAGHPTYVEPPIKDRKTLTLYDSVVDKVNEPSIFVIFHDAHVYPEYLVSFRSDYNG